MARHTNVQVTIAFKLQHPEPENINLLHAKIIDILINELHGAMITAVQSMTLHRDQQLQRSVQFPCPQGDVGNRCC